MSEARCPLVPEGTAGLFNPMQADYRLATGQSFLSQSIVLRVARSEAFLTADGQVSVDARNESLWKRKCLAERRQGAPNG